MHLADGIRCRTEHRAERLSTRIKLQDRVRVAAVQRHVPTRASACCSRRGGSCWSRWTRGGVFVLRVFVMLLHFLPRVTLRAEEKRKARNDDADVVEGVCHGIF